MLKKQKRPSGRGIYLEFCKESLTDLEQLHIDIQEVKERLIETKEESKTELGYFLEVFNSKENG